MAVIHYLYRPEHEEQIEELKNLETDEEILFHVYESQDELKALEFSAISHLIITGTLACIKTAFALAKAHSISVGVVPLPSQNKLTKILNLPKSMREAFAVAMVPGEKKVDLFYCNDSMILSDVRIGNTSALREFEYDYTHLPLVTRLKHFWRTWREKRPLQHHYFRIRTDKEDEIGFSAVGLIGMDYHNHSWIAGVLSKQLGSDDNQHLLAVLSPRSLLQHFITQPLMLFIRKKGTTKLPNSLGLIKSNRMEIECDAPQEVVIDDTESMQTPVVLRSEEGALALSVGESFWRQPHANKTDRSTIRLDNIPKDEENAQYLTNGLPLFSHASQEQYATLFSGLREEAQTTSAFIVLLLLSTILATLGLFINSSSIIIGAMLLAPLMQPIVSLSMGVLRQDTTLEMRAAKTIAYGVATVLATSAVIALMLPVEQLTSEMIGRLSPTILDMFVATVSGIAAAYVKSNDKLLGSLAGVAIAVALVPPIAVAGIGLGWGEWSMFGSAFLLFVTNLVGIVFAAALTFVLLGFSPLHVAKKGLLIWLGIALVVAMPLYSAFATMQERARIQQRLTCTTFQAGNKQVKLTHVELINRKKSVELRCEMITSKMLTDNEKTYLKKLLSNTIGRQMDIVATFRYRL